MIETESTEYNINGLKIEIPSSWRKEENTNSTTYFYSSINQDFCFLTAADGVGPRAAWKKGPPAFAGGSF